MTEPTKYALVTGGSRGIGREICLKLARSGYYVLINYRSNADEAQRTLEGVRAAGGDGSELPTSDLGAAFLYDPCRESAHFPSLADCFPVRPR